MPSEILSPTLKNLLFTGVYFDEHQFARSKFDHEQRRQSHQDSGSPGPELSEPVSKRQRTRKADSQPNRDIAFSDSNGPVLELSSKEKPQQNQSPALAKQLSESRGPMDFNEMIGYIFKEKILGQPEFESVNWVDLDTVQSAVSRHTFIDWTCQYMRSTSTKALELPVLQRQLLTRISEPIWTKTVLPNLCQIAIAQVAKGRH
jgi:hypothetical protein